MILKWRKNPSMDIEVDPISKHLMLPNNAWSDLIIDGQQRITALYPVKKGSIREGRKTREIFPSFDHTNEEFKIVRSRSSLKPPRELDAKEVLEKPITALVGDRIDDLCALLGRD